MLFNICIFFCFFISCYSSSIASYSYSYSYSYAGTWMPLTSYTSLRTKWTWNCLFTAPSPLTTDVPDVGNLFTVKGWVHGEGEMDLCVNNNKLSIRHRLVRSLVSIKLQWNSFFWEKNSIPPHFCVRICLEQPPPASSGHYNSLLSSFFAQELIITLNLNLGIIFISASDHTLQR